jgi:hypothetical protein
MAIPTPRPPYRELIKRFARWVECCQVGGVMLPPRTQTKTSSFIDELGICRDAVGTDIQRNEAECDQLRTLLMSPQSVLRLPIVVVDSTVALAALSLPTQ